MHKVALGILVPTKKGKKKEADDTLTAEQALDLLDTYKEKRKLRVHTMTGAMGAMGIVMGCAIDLSDIKKRFKNAKKGDIGLAGPNMRNSRHGVYFFEKGKGTMFLQTNDTKLSKIHKERFGK